MRDMNFLSKFIPKPINIAVTKGYSVSIERLAKVKKLLKRL